MEEHTTSKLYCPLTSTFQIWFSFILSILITNFILIVNYLFLKRFFSFNTALIGSILFLTMNWDYYFLFRPWVHLSDFFCFLTLIVSYNVYFGPKRYYNYFFLGILSGVAFSFHPLGVFILIFSFLIQLKKWDFKNFGLFLLALLIVFVPFLFFTDIKTFYIAILNKEDITSVSAAFAGHEVIEISPNIFGRMFNFFTPALIISFIYLSFENLLRIVKYRKYGKEALVLAYTGEVFILAYSGLVFIFGSFTYLDYKGYSVVFLTIPTVMLSAILLGKIILDFYKECYDVLGYSIANTYTGDVKSISNECDKLGENKYYCYRSLGKVLGREAMTLNNLTLNKCDEVEFNRWCEEGFYEELSFHRIGNLSLENEMDIYYNEGDGWSLINFNIEENLDRFDGLELNLDSCKGFQRERVCYENLPWIYSVINMRTNYNFPREVFLLESCSELEEPYQTNCYMGWFKNINYVNFPYVESIDTCYRWEGKCKYACFLSLGMKVGFRYPDAEAGEKVCKIVGGSDKEFMEICYAAIGFSSANRFYYNTSIAFEECKKIEDSKACLNGVSYFTDGEEYHQILSNMIGEEKLAECRMTGELNFVGVSDFHLKDMEIENASIKMDLSEDIQLSNLTLINSSIDIENSKNVYIKNLNSINSSLNIIFSNQILIEKINLYKSNFTLLLSEKIDLDEVDSKETFIVIDRSKGVYLNKFNLKDNIKRIISSDISLENSEINNTIYSVHNSKIYIDGVFLSNTSIHMSNLSNVYFKKYSLVDSNATLEDLSNVSLNGLILNSTNFTISRSKYIDMENLSFEKSSISLDALLNTNIDGFKSGNTTIEMNRLDDTYLKNWESDGNIIKMRYLNDINMINVSSTDNSINIKDSLNLFIEKTKLYNSAFKLDKSDIATLKISKLEKSSIDILSSNISLVNVDINKSLFSTQKSSITVDRVVFKDTSADIDDSFAIDANNISLIRTPLYIGQSLNRMSFPMDYSNFIFLTELYSEESPIDIIGSLNTTIHNLTLINGVIRIDNSSIVRIDGSKSNYSETKISYSSDIDIKNLNYVSSSINIDFSSNAFIGSSKINNSSFILSNSIGISLKDLNTDMSSINLFSSLDVSLSSFVVNRSIFSAGKSSTTINNLSFQNATADIYESFNVEVCDLNLFKTPVHIDRSYNISFDKITSRDSSIRIENSSSTEISRCVFECSDLEEGYDYLDEMGIEVINSKKVILEDCEISNFEVNLLVERAQTMLVKNSIIKNANFRNFYGKCVDNLKIENVSFSNASNDQSIDFSECESRDIIIRDSVISNSAKGIRLDKVKNVTVENNKIINCKIGIRIDKGVYSVNLINNILDNSGHPCILVHKDSLPEIRLEGNEMKNCAEASEYKSYEIVR